MSALVFRKCETSDIPTIAELEKACFSDAWTREQLEGEFSRFGFLGLVAEEDGEIIGYGFLGVLFERAELDRIAVSPSQRGKGVGGKLLDELLKKAAEKGASEMLLEVRESNAFAIRLYESRGFTLFHTRKNYYGGGEAALEYRMGI